MSVAPHCSNRTPHSVDINPGPQKFPGPVNDDQDSDDPFSDLDQPLASPLLRRGKAPDRVAVPPSSETIQSPTVGKGKGKGKNRAKASEQAMEKTKFADTQKRCSNRLKAKREKEVEQNIKAGMNKLLSSSRKLTDDSDELDGTNQPLVGDFSSHDLIRNRIAPPNTFDELPQEPPSDDIVVISHENVPRTESGSVNTRWSFSINPLAYFRSETPVSGGTPGNEAKERDHDSEQVGPISPPQLTSTPKE